MVEIMERAPSSNLPEAEIAENFSAIMLAGFHTTQNALCAAIYFVLTHQDAKQKLTAELDSVFSSPAEIDGRTAKMPYLNAVITEAMRLYPPVPVGGPRVSPGSYVDGVYIPAGVSLHHMPSHVPCEYTDTEDRLRFAPHFSPCIITPNTSTPPTNLSRNAGQILVAQTEEMECRHSSSVVDRVLPSISPCRCFNLPWRHFLLSLTASMSAESRIGRARADVTLSGRSRT